RDFNSQIAAAASALVPIARDVERQEREKAYLARYESAPETTKKYFSRVALAVPEKGELNLFLLDSRAHIFRKADWPLGWAKLREGLGTRLSGGPPSERYRPEGVIEFPRFGRNPRDAEGRRWRHGQCFTASQSIRASRAATATAPRAWSVDAERQSCGGLA